MNAFIHLYIYFFLLGLFPNADFYLLLDCVATLIGSGDVEQFVGCYHDGPGDRSSFFYPNGIAVSQKGNRIFVADTYNSRIRSIGCDRGEA